MPFAWASNRLQYEIARCKHAYCSGLFRFVQVSRDVTPTSALHATEEVSSLAGGAQFESLPAPLPDGIRFFPSLLPVSPSPVLTIGLLKSLRIAPPWGAIPAYHVPLHLQTDLEPFCVPDGTSDVSARRQYSPTCSSVPSWLWSRRVALAPHPLRHVNEGSDRLFLSVISWASSVCYSLSMRLSSTWDPTVSG